MIDLDVAPPPRAAAPRSPFTRPGVTRAALALLLVLGVLGTLTAAAPPLPTLTPVLTVGRPAAVAFTLGPAVLFTVDVGADADGRTEIRRYALDDGSVQWSATAPEPVRGLVFVEPAQVLMAESNNSPQIAFLDARTGRELWRSTTPNTGAVSTTDTGVLLISSGTGRGDDLLRLADLRSGRTVWSRRMDPGTQLHTGDPTGDPPRRIVLITMAGRISVVDVADGTDLASTALGVPLHPFPLDGDDQLELTLVQDSLYIARRVRGTTSLTAYAIDGLRRRWRSDGAPMGQISGCGRYVCVTGETLMTVLDGRDGSVRWADPRWRYGAEDTVRNGRPTIYAMDGRDNRTTALLDAATGRVLESLGSSVYLGALQLRTDVVMPARVWVSARDPRGGLRTLGALDTPIPHGCVSTGRHLACPTSTGPVTVWRLPA